MPPIALPSSLQGWVLLVCGGFYTLTSLWYVFRAWRTLSWPSTTGRIGYAAPVSGEESVSDYITYSYKVGPDLFVNDQVAVGPRLRFASASRFKAWLAATYPHRDAVTVHYNPERPADSVLRPGLSLTLVANLLIGIGCVAAALLVSASGLE